MAERNPWEPKQWLEERRWSLLPNVGLAAWAAYAALVVWLGVVLAALFATAPEWWRLLPAGTVGAWSVYYMARRLGGRDAPTGGASSAVRVDSPFQARLAFDIMAIVVLITAAAALFAQ
jgi:hypothetical protein